MCQKGKGSSSGECGKVGSRLWKLVPPAAVCREALEAARDSLSASILYHSFRVFLYCVAFTVDGEGRDVPYDDELSPLKLTPTELDIPLEVIFVACLFHDLGTTSKYDKTQERFEVSGADAAVKLLETYGTKDDHIRQAWLAITLHTSGGIAERMDGLVRRLRLAVRADFGSYPVPSLRFFEAETGSKDGWDFMEEQLPRLNIEKDLGDAVVRQALHRPEKAPPSSWPADLLRAKKEDPEWEGVNKAF